jgi:hypothetical protein
MKKKIILPAVGLAIIGSVLGGSIVLSHSGADDVPPIVQQVQHNTEELDNHESRITNLENDTKDLQNKTGISSSPNNTTPPPVTTPKADKPLTQSSGGTIADPEPVTVTAYEKINVDDSETDCRITYSDSTTYQWVWQTVEYNQGNKIIHTHGVCNSTVIGTKKS